MMDAGFISVNSTFWQFTHDIKSTCTINLLYLIGSQTRKMNTQKKNDDEETTKRTLEKREVKKRNSNSFKRVKYTQKHIICQLKHIKGEQCLLKRRLEKQSFFLSFFLTFESLVAINKYTKISRQRFFIRQNNKINTARTDNKKKMNCIISIIHSVSLSFS